MPNNRSAELARMRPTIQKWINEAAAGSVTRIVNANYITETADLSGYLTIANGDVRYYPRSTLDSLISALQAESHPEATNTDGTITIGTGQVLSVNQAHDFTLTGDVKFTQPLTVTTRIQTDSGNLQLAPAANVEIIRPLYVTGATDFSENITISAGKTIDGVDLSVHVVTDDAHHDPVSAGDGVGVSGQVVSGDRSLLAFVDQTNTFQVGQQFSSTVGITGAVTAGSSITAQGDLITHDNVRAMDRVIIGSHDNPLYALDVRGDGSISTSLTVNGDWLINEAITSLDTVWSADGNGTKISQTEVWTEQLHANSFFVDTMVINTRTATGGGMLFTPGSAAVLKEPMVFPPTCDANIHAWCEQLIDGLDAVLQDENGDPLEYEDPDEFWIAVQDPPTAHIAQFEEGERVLIDGYYTDQSGGSVGLVDLYDLIVVAGAPMIHAANWSDNPTEFYGTVQLVLDGGDYYAYVLMADHDYSSWVGYFPAETAIVGFRTPSTSEPEGLMSIDTAAGVYSPFLKTEIITGDPWERQKTLWLGNLSGAPGGRWGEYGMMAGTDLSDLTASRFVVSQNRFELLNPELAILRTLPDGSAVESLKLHDKGLSLWTPVDNPSYIWDDAANEAVEADSQWGVIDFLSDVKNRTTAIRYASITSQVEGIDPQPPSWDADWPTLGEGITGGLAQYSTLRLQAHSGAVGNGIQLYSYLDDNTVADLHVRAWESGSQIVGEAGAISLSASDTTYLQSGSIRVSSYALEGDLMVIFDDLPDENGLDELEAGALYYDSSTGALSIKL